MSESDVLQLVEKIVSSVLNKIYRKLKSQPFPVDNITSYKIKRIFFLTARGTNVLPRRARPNRQVAVDRQQTTRTTPTDTVKQLMCNSFPALSLSNCMSTGICTVESRLFTLSNKYNRPFPVSIRNLYARTQLHRHLKLHTARQRCIQVTLCSISLKHHLTPGASPANSECF